MAANDHISPSQFGFKDGGSDWYSALDKYDEGGGQRGRINPNRELYTGQPGMSQEIVDHYAGQKSPRAGHDVEIYHHEGKVWVGDGHHRIAAARQKGQKSIRVVHYGRI